MMWPAAAVRDLRGVDVRIIPASANTQIAGVVRGKKLVDVMHPPDADVIVFQRPTNVFLSQAIPLLRSKGIACVVDMDDDLRTIHPSNPAFDALHPNRGPKIHSWHNAAEACKKATLITVSTPALARRYGTDGRTFVIHNRVPKEFLDVEHEDSTLIGWGGSVHSHPNDLQVIGAAVSRLVTAGSKFQVIGNGEDVGRILGLNGSASATGLVRFHDWATTLTQLGVGVAPLADTVFNQAKSWLKPLEYSAAGVPWVGSDRVEYRRLHELGCGVVVEKPREWEGALRKITRDEAWRRELSDRGRNVAANLTFERGVDLWYAAWSRAMQLERIGDLISL
jgi:glycosyltransferase involved in cell wall biosynthesis